ncbi:MAG: aminoacetone oxidase family FAD-binding enzyme, partial [Candidatus Omnitrophica bacterium]|nr:aminoacetone oxidase family FAD-binding enzyme [Candidatus Omnitrophota bacterium]
APLRGCLVPLRTKETWVRELQGLSLKNVRVSFEYNERSPRSEKDKAKNITSAVGEMMFTHFGVSGPLILDLSGDITAVLKRQKEIRLFLDLKPGMDREKLKNRLLSEFKANGSVKLKNIMKNLLPQRLINVFLRPLGADPEKTASTVTREERHKIIELLKSFPLTITGSLSINRAMVTSGGVSTGEIDPRTMESRVIPGLYFAGEIIDGAAPSGGYNLQQAFSTGFLAGESASHA